LLNGKAIRIEGGNFQLALQRFRCNFGHEWDVPFEVMVSAPPQVCPTCSTPSVSPLQPRGFGRGKGQRGHSRGRRRL
jgi:hypothetical protein